MAKTRSVTLTAAAALLSAARSRRKLKQSEIAKRMGVSQATVSLWETGRTRPRDIAKAARVYGVDVRRLVAA